VLDPFCGYGAIPLECARSFPAKQIIASDNDAALVVALQRKVASHGKASNVRVHRRDALHLTEIAAGSVQRVITDPPWGYFQQSDVDFAAFYAQMLGEWARVLSAGGLCVVLTARKHEFEAAATDTPALAVLVKYDILVSGKKAAVYKLQKSE
jgi:tRNA (guanine6-N2)-methyltransferase